MHFCLFKHVRTKNPAFFVKWTNTAGIPPNIGFDWVLSIWVFVYKMMMELGFRMGTLLYGIVFCPYD